MDDRTFETLELGSLVELLARHVQTALGKRRALGLRPMTRFDAGARPMTAFFQAEVIK